MRSQRYPTDRVLKHLRERKIATLGELKLALGTQADATVFRKLGQLGYCSSYSHRGRYYTLDETPRFDALGLWSIRNVWFSRYSTLVATAEAFVEQADAGYYATELGEALHVDVKVPLLKLLGQSRIARERVLARYLYCSCDSQRRQQQLRARRVHESQMERRALQLPGTEEGLHQELRAAVILFHRVLDERQKRLYAGLESLKVGHGGDRRIARLLGIEESTVARGRHELITGDVQADRVRKKGGGRKAMEKKRRRSSKTSKN